MKSAVQVLLYGAVFILTSTACANAYGGKGKHWRWPSPSPSPSATPTPAPSLAPSPTPSPTPSPSPSPSLAGVNQYYVATTGSDSNNGSSSAPWKTIQHADSALALGSAGTIVHVAPGTYSGPISTTRSGTSSARISYVSDSKWGAKIVSSSSGVMWSVKGSYTDINGFEFDGSLNSSICCAIASYSTTRLGIYNNKIHDTAAAGNSTQDAVILLTADISTTSVVNSNSIVQGNYLYHNNKGAAGSTANNSGQHGIYSAAAGDIIRNNVIIDQGGGWCLSSWHKVTNWTVVNNTLVNCEDGGIVVGDDSATGVLHNNDTITNNIIVNSGSSATNNGGINFRQCGTNNYIANNLMYGNVGGNFVGSCSSTPVNTQSGSNSTTFVNYTGTGAGDYHLLSGSTGIDHGTALCTAGVTGCAPARDLDGGSRPVNNTWDIGAYEYGAAAGFWPYQ